VAIYVRPGGAVALPLFGFVPPVSQDATKIIVTTNFVVSIEALETQKFVLAL